MFDFQDERCFTVDEYDSDEEETKESYCERQNTLEMLRILHRESQTNAVHFLQSLIFSFSLVNAETF